VIQKYYTIIWKSQMNYINNIAALLLSYNNKLETDLERWARVEYPNENRAFALSILREKGRAPRKGLDY
jgi:hypothetical protein